MDFFVIESDPKTWKNAIKDTCDKLLAEGYVKEAFYQAVVAREMIAPTGLPTPVNVAIPHTDPIYVNKAGLCVLRLKSPVIFNEMGNSDNTIEALFVITMALNDAEDQVPTLKKIIETVQDEKFMKELYLLPLPEVQSTLSMYLT